MTVSRYINKAYLNFYSTCDSTKLACLLSRLLCCLVSYFCDASLSARYLVDTDMLATLKQTSTLLEKILYHIVSRILGGIVSMIVVHGNRGVR